MKLNTLNDLLLHELQDIRSFEEQLLDAIPRMAQAARNPDLRKALEDHLKETQEQLIRVKGLLSSMGAPASGSKCAGMAGIIKEGSEILALGGDPAVVDAGIIGAAQRVEHYEIAVYGTVRSLAETLGLHNVASVLQESLDEEKAADEKLTTISEPVNSAAGSRRA